MATPTYFGTGQPTADSGSSWLGRLGSFFGTGGMPQYLGNGQPSSGGGSLGNTPAYLPAPEPAPVTSTATDACESCPIDPGAIAAGQIAIVIPRPGT